MFRYVTAYREIETSKALVRLRSRGSLRALRVLGSPGLCNPTRPFRVPRPILSISSPNATVSRAHRSRTTTNSARSRR